MCGPHRGFVVNRGPVQRVASDKLVLFALIGTLLIVAPLSVSGLSNRGGEDLIKWARVVTLLFICISGLRWFRVPRTTECSFRLLVFAGFFTGAAIWSTSPLWGLAFKSMFLASVVAGISLSRALQTELDFQTFARITTLAAVVALTWVGYFVVTQEVMLSGRLWIGDLNPNFLGQSASLFSLLTIFHVCFERRKSWRMVAGSCTLLMGTVTVLSGSRGSALMLFAGLVILIPTLGRGRRQVIVMSVGSGLLLLVLGMFWFAEPTPSESLESNAAVKLRIVGELTKDTRFRVWTAVINSTMEVPIIGRGWLHEGRRAGNVQSAYLQVFAESGIVGLVVMGWFLMSALRRVVTSLRLGWKVSGLPSVLCYVFSAALFGILFHALFESSVMTGASPNAVLLSLCAAQLDQLTRWGRRQGQSRSSLVLHQHPLVLQESSTKSELMNSVR